MNNRELETYSYGKLIYELIKLGNLHKFEIKLIGHEKFEKINASYPIYRFTVNPNARIKFGIVTGMHGDEIAGPLSMYHLFKNPKKYFHSDICYYIYSTISPTAFDLRRRYDDDNVELNSLSKKTLRNYKYHEIKYFYQDVKNKKFDAFISIHEDVLQKRFYAYVNDENSKIYGEIMKNGEKHFGILPKKDIYGRMSNKEGIIVGGHDQTTEDWIFIHKKPSLCLTTETPGKGELDLRIATNLYNILILNKYILKKVKRKNKTK